MLNVNNMQCRFKRIVGGLTFYLHVGFFVFGWWLGPALLGYDGAFAADMAFSALPVLIVLCVVLLPFFILLGASLEVILELLKFPKERINLR